MISLLRSFWKGEIELKKSYWFGLVSVSILLNIIAYFLPENFFLNGLFLFFIQPIMIFLWVGTWRSAKIYKKSKKKIWAILAQTHIVFGAITLIGFWFVTLYELANTI